MPWSRNGSRIATKRRLPPGSLSLGLTFWLATGCITFSPADRHYNNGDYARAAAAYERNLEKDTWRSKKDRALYRLALIYASSEAPLRDRERALELLQQLLDEHPKSSYRPSALWIRDLAETLATLREETDRKEDQIDSLLQEVDEVQHGSEQLEKEAGSRVLRIRQLARQVRQLQSDIDRLTAELAEREAELQLLKEIDLSTPP